MLTGTSIARVLPIGALLLLATALSASSHTQDCFDAQESGKIEKCSLLELTRQLSAAFPGEKLDVRFELDGGSQLYDVTISVVPR